MQQKNVVTKSLLWSTIDRFSVQGVQFAIGIYVASILLPEDYALVAMLSIFMAIAQSLVDSGFAYSLIQKKCTDPIDFNTVFYFNLLVSTLFYLLLFALAQPIASFYEKPELINITRVFSLSIIINALSIVQQARLTIDLNFKHLAIISFLSVLIGGIVAIYLAWQGLGVWTLVIQMLVSSSVRTLLLWLFSPWFLKWQFSMISFKKLFSFGSRLMFSSLLHTIYVNLYTMIIGKKFPEAQLGYYNRAASIAQFPSSNLTNIIIRAIFPIQCRMQDDDQQLKESFFRYMRMSCYVIFPIMITLVVLAQPLVQLLLTDKWLGSVPMIQLLSLAYMWDPIMKINNNIITVKGRSDLFLKAEVWKKITAFVVLFATIPFGVLAMCGGLLFYAFCDIYIISFYTRRVTGIKLIEQIAALVPVLLLTSSMGIVLYITMLLVDGLILKIVITSIVAIMYYTLVSVLFKIKEINLLIKMIKGTV